MADGCVRLMTENFADVDVLANYYVSSEDASFPVLNSFNGLRRSKVWRSQGYWKIVSGDNTIVFNEGGSDFTATITAGEYTSTSSFMTALDAAFTTAPGATGSYTVTQNSNLKFVITKSAGTFTIKWTHADSADMAAILGYDTASNDSGALAYTADILKINSGEEWILWDMGISSLPDAFMMTGPRNRSLKLSPGGTFTLQGNETNDFSSPSFSETLTYDDEVIALIRENGLHTEALRYWRIKFNDQNPLGYIEIGAFFLGQYWTPTRGRAQFPLGGAYVDRSVEVYSEGGQAFSDIFEQTEQFSIEWMALTKDDKEGLQRVFRMFGKHTPFFISMDTDAAFSSSQQRMIRYVKFRDEPTYALISPNNFTANMDLIEQL